MKDIFQTTRKVISSEKANLNKKTHLLLLETIDLQNPMETRNRRQKQRVLPVKKRRKSCSRNSSNWSRKMKS